MVGGCPECGGKLLLDSKRGETSCQDCGLVVEEEIVDAYPEVVDGQVQREGPGKIDPQHIFGSRDASGRPVDSEWRRRRRRTAEVFNLSQDDRRRLRIARDIGQICSVHGIPRDIADRAAHIYRKTLEAKVIAKASTKDLALACIIAACRERLVFIDVQELCKEVGKPATPLRYCHIISRELGLTANMPTAENYIIAFADRLRGGKGLELEALRVFRLYGGSNVNVKCLAAAATYLACLNVGMTNVTQKAVKDATGVSEVTIRTWTLALRKILGAELKREPLVRDDFSDVQE